MPPIRLLRRRSGSIKPEGCGLFGVCPVLCLPPSVDSGQKNTALPRGGRSGFENEAKMTYMMKQDGNEKDGNERACLWDLDGPAKTTLKQQLGSFFTTLARDGSSRPTPARFVPAFARAALLRPRRSGGLGNWWGKRPSSAAGGASPGEDAVHRRRPRKRVRRRRHRPSPPYLGRPGPTFNSSRWEQRRHEHANAGSQFQHGPNVSHTFPSHGPAGPAPSTVFDGPSTSS